MTLLSTLSKLSKISDSSQAEFVYIIIDKNFKSVLASTIHIQIVQAPQTANWKKDHKFLERTLKTACHDTSDLAT